MTWQRRQRAGRRPARTHGWLPTPMEFALACIVAILAVIAWFALNEETSSTAVAAANGTPTGRASVIDGDTIEIHSEPIRILDIDAPESRQTCTTLNSIEWRCGQKAALALSDWIGQQAVTCASMGAG